MELFETILKVKDNSIDAQGTKIKLKPNLPVNTSDIINQIVSAYQAGILPLKVLLGWLPDIDDVDEVLKQLNTEKEKAIELNQKAYGVQAKDSHSDLDKGSEEDNYDDYSTI